MSTTTTTTQAQPAALQTVLQDYRLHHSEASGDAAKAESTRSSSSTATAAQPPVAWDVSHRRVPPYRPTNRDRDQAEVAVYLSGAERAFITTMFTGLFVNASTAKAWRSTVGKLNSNIFRYSVGGER
ncbi:hypothetical protein NLU13_9753 [Sarocladium strictum]|uniref:Uncharacterized protein n=1 Tax=Sarocladium strictum TaxID=5046 RepID=A0AA39GAP5_SARSR|nr:hypothetical protein NLU13_9753 [Sarocladium strictum]